MPDTVLPADPCLLSILLICQSRSSPGPELVTRWPPDLAYRQAVAKSDHPGVDTDYTDGSGESSDDEQPTSRTISPMPVRLGNRDDSGTDGSKLIGFDEASLLSLLTPTKVWHDHKFELTVNEITFIGHPIFASATGQWLQESEPNDSTNVGKHKVSDWNRQPIMLSGNTRATAHSIRPDLKRNVTSELLMYHVVFVMNPPALHHNLRVSEMYEFVVKKFSKALEWLQIRHDYVNIEIQDNLRAKQDMRERTRDTAKAGQQSRRQHNYLVNAIKTVFEAISRGKIASAQLMKDYSVSLQIPITTSTSYLPSLSEIPLPPGLSLTTYFENLEEIDSDLDLLNSTTAPKIQTLLLKSHPQKIIKDLQGAEGNTSPQLTRFISSLNATKSLFKLSQLTRIAMADIQLMAAHLVEWRRAVIIPSLHQRDTYIISPNADFSKLREATQTYTLQFPAAMPNLPHILEMLSGLPRPYGTIIPSYDHKETYMQALTWLLQNGWVTQLRTFAYIRVAPEIKRAVGARVTETQQAKVEEERARPSSVSRRTSGRKQLVRDGDTKVSTSHASIILDPPRASAIELQWLEEVRKSLLNDDGICKKLSRAERQELFDRWPMLVKFFNGEIGLESVPVRVGLKREPVWHLYGKLGLNFDRGVEDDEEKNSSLLVTVRHW